MTNKITLSGWHEGLDQIKLTLLQNSMFDMPLHDAKNNVENLLRDKIVNIFTDDINNAFDFARQAKKIGVFCTIS